MLCNASLRFFFVSKLDVQLIVLSFRIFKIWNYNFQLNVMQHMWIRTNQDSSRAFPKIKKLQWLHVAVILINQEHTDWTGLAIIWQTANLLENEYIFRLLHLCTVKSWQMHKDESQKLHSQCCHKRHYSRLQHKLSSIFICTSDQLLSWWSNSVKRIILSKLVKVSIFIASFQK